MDQQKNKTELIEANINTILHNSVKLPSFLILMIWAQIEKKTTMHTSKLQKNGSCEPKIRKAEDTTPDVKQRVGTT